MREPGRRESMVAAESIDLCDDVATLRFGASPTPTPRKWRTVQVLTAAPAMRFKPPMINNQHGKCFATSETATAVLDV